MSNSSKYSVGPRFHPSMPTSSILIPDSCEDVLRDRSMRRVYIFPSSKLVERKLGQLLVVHGMGLSHDLTYVIADADGDSIATVIEGIRDDFEITFKLLDSSFACKGLVILSVYFGEYLSFRAPIGYFI